MVPEGVYVWTLIYIGKKNHQLLHFFESGSVAMIRSAHRPGRLFAKEWPFDRHCAAPGSVHLSRERLILNVRFRTTNIGLACNLMAADHLPTPYDTNMGKFEDMCKAFAGAQVNYKIFRDESHRFAQEVWDRMIAYFEIPRPQITLYQIDPKGGFHVTNPPMSRILNLRDDGFWEFGVGITVYESPTAFPRDTILLYLLVRKDLKGSFQAKLNGEEQVFTIHEGSAEDYSRFFDHLFATIVDSYETGLERLIKEQTVNRIGFDLREMTTASRRR